MGQCPLSTKGEIPFAFITWAWVNDEVDQRLRAGAAKIASHEWKSVGKFYFPDAPGTRLNKEFHIFNGL